MIELSNPTYEADHCMIDLETMGTDPYAPVITIAACAMRLDNEDVIDDMFSVNISLESCMALGMRPSASTIQWWLTGDKVPQSARELAFTSDAMPLPAALDTFTTWMNSRPLKVWGNSARFDCGLLGAAYKICGKELPWTPWNERCYRTIKNLPGAKGISIQRFGVYHHAIDDAISQAMHLREINKALQLQL